LRGNPWIDQVIPFQSLSQALGQIRASNFTHLIDLHGNLRSFALRKLYGIPNIAVYKKDALERRLFVGLGVPSPALQKHTVERYLEALNAFGVPKASSNLTVGEIGGSTTPQGQPKKVLLIQSAFLGDSLLTLP